MITTDVINLIANIMKSLAKQKDFTLPAGRSNYEHPQIYKYFFPIKIKSENKNSPYIVIKFNGEEQELWGNTDESFIKINLIIGLCADDEYLSENTEILLAALEKIELFLKDNSILEGCIKLNKASKMIPSEQPIPYIEGKIMLEYSYYKPIAVEEP